MSERQLVTVCDRCFRACCWQGEFMCDAARNAGTVNLPVETLIELSQMGGFDVEHPHYWSTRAPHTEAAKAPPITQQEDEMSESTYESAVNGRREFRQAYRDMKRLKEKYGLALMMIREGCAEPQRVAADALKDPAHTP